MARLFVASGSDEFLEADTPVVTAAPFTVAGWGRMVDITGGHVNFALQDKDVIATGWFLAFRGSQAGDPISWFVDDGITGEFVAETTTGYSSNTWHHAAAREVSTTSRNVLIDGGSEATDTNTSNPLNVDRTSIARRGDSTPTNYLDGHLSWHVVWDVGLSDNEMGALARGVNPFAIRDGSMVALWPIEGNDSPEIDYKGTLDLNVNGTPLKSTTNPPVELLENYI